VSALGQILPFDCGLVDGGDGLRARRGMARDVVPERFLQRRPDFPADWELALRGFPLRA
jgi:hypothetical protein